MRIESTEDDDALAMQQVLSIPAEKLVYDVPASVFVGFRRPPHSSPTGACATFAILVRGKANRTLQRVSLAQ